MNDVARVTVLADNCVRGQGLLAEHGLAFWVEIRGQHLLFDTGQGFVLAHNAEKLGLPLERVNAVVLSHGHYDHTGGLAHVLQVASEARVYAHPSALLPKYARHNDGTIRQIGIPATSKTALREHDDTLTWTRGSTQIADGVFVTGEIPRRTTYEDAGGPFLTGPQGGEPDSLPDDQAVFFESRAGTIALLGCAHAGAVNTLRYIHELTGARPIHTVIGGMHLSTAPPERIGHMVRDLRELDVQRLGPAHCTGLAATVELWKALPDRCFVCAVGTTMEFDLP